MSDRSSRLKLQRPSQRARGSQMSRARNRLKVTDDAEAWRVIGAALAEEQDPIALGASLPTLQPSVVRMLSRTVGNRQLGRMQAAQPVRRAFGDWLLGTDGPPSTAGVRGPIPMPPTMGFGVAPAPTQQKAASTPGKKPYARSTNQVEGTGGIIPVPPELKGAAPGGLMPMPPELQEAASGGTAEPTPAAEQAPGGLMPMPPELQEAASGGTSEPTQATEQAPGGLMPMPPELQEAAPGGTAEPTQAAEQAPGGLMPMPPELQEATPGGTSEPTQAAEQAPGGLMPMPPELQEAAPGGGAPEPAETREQVPQAAEQPEARQAQEEVRSGTEDAQEEAAAEVGPAPTVEQVEGTRGPEETPDVIDWAQRAQDMATRIIEGVRRHIGAAAGFVSRALGRVTDLAGSVAEAIRGFVASPVRALVASWNAVSSLIGSAVSRATAGARALLDQARQYAGRIVSAVTDLLGRALGHARDRGAAMLRTAYAGVVNMVRSARAAATRAVTALVSRVVAFVQRTGRQARALVQQAGAAVVTQIRELRASARAQLDEALSEAGPVPPQTAVWVRTRIRSYAQRALATLPRALSNVRSNTVGALRRGIESALEIVREYAQEAAAGFRARFAGPLATAREHVPELVGEVEGGMSEIGEASAMVPAITIAEATLTEAAIQDVEASLQSEAEATGSTL